MHDTQPTEELLGHLKAARAIVRKMLEAGASSVEPLYRDLTSHEEHISGRFKELQDWNKKQEPITQKKVKK